METNNFFKEFFIFMSLVILQTIELMIYLAAILIVLIYYLEKLI